MQIISYLAQASNNGAGFALGGAFFLIFILFAVLTSIFWLWMLIDCLTSTLPSTEKIIWVLVIVFLHFIGALIYFLVGRSGRRVG